MDRLAALFEQFPLPEIARLLRRTVFAALAVGIVALGISAALTHILAGVGVCIGLGIGLVNIRLVTRSVAKVNLEQPERPKRVLASKTMYRLVFTTILVIALALASVELGIGTAAGISLFYLLLVFNLIVALLHSGQSGVAA